jgi:hypothetical protein
MVLKLTLRSYVNYAYIYFIVDCESYGHVNLMLSGQWGFLEVIEA